MTPRQPPVLTVGLNPAIDVMLEAPGFAVGRHVPARFLLQQAAGKATNVARALARLGRQVTATGFVGTEGEPRYLRELIEVSPGAIACRFVPVQGATRQNITIVDPIGRTDTHLRQAGLAVTRPDLSLLRSRLGELAFPAEATAPAAVVFSGSLPPGVSTADLAALLRAAIQAPGAGRGRPAAGRVPAGTACTLVLDLDGTVLREVLSLLPPAPGSGSARPFLLLKPNEAELAAATGRTGFDDEAAVLMAATELASLAQWLIVSRGSRGAILFHAGGIWRGRLDLDPLRVRRTVGCGDCLLAGALEAILSGREPREILAMGLACGAGNALHHEIAGFGNSDLADLVRQAQVTPLK